MKTRIVVPDQRNVPGTAGEILKNGQFKVVSRTKGLVEPEPWSKYTSPDKGCDWVGHQGTYQKKA